MQFSIHIDMKMLFLLSFNIFKFLNTYKPTYFGYYKMCLKVNPCSIFPQEILLLFVEGGPEI